MKAIIKNDQSKATWTSVTVEIPATLKDAIALYGADVPETIYQFAIEKSNLDVRLRSLIKDAASAQAVVDNFFKGLTASALTVNDMTVKLVSLVGDSLLSADMVAPFFSAKTADIKKKVFKALLVKAEDAKAGLEDATEAAED